VVKYKYLYTPDTKVKERLSKKEQLKDLQNRREQLKQAGMFQRVIALDKQIYRLQHELGEKK
jgi:hypothetical protein